MADKDQETLTAVGPGADEDELDTSTQGGDDRSAGAGDDYEYPEGEEPGEGGAREERAGHAEEEPEGGEERHLTREQKRRQRRKARYEGQNRELTFLRARNEQLEREHSRRLAEMENRQTQSDVLAIDQRISTAEANIREAETLHQQALDAKDHAAAIEALRVKDQLRDGLLQLRNTKNNAIQQARARQQASQQPQPDPEVAAQARSWMGRNPWFDGSLRDEDSAVLQAVERAVFREGRHNPRTAEYWDEVDRRAAKRLPERYGTSQRRRDDDDDFEDDDRDDSRTERRNGNGRTQERTPSRRSAPTFKVGGRERTLRRGEVYIDEDRKQAMIEAGVWEDPERRQRYMKAYQKYDRDAGRRPR